MTGIVSPQKGVSYSRHVRKSPLVAFFYIVACLLSSPAIAQENKSRVSRSPSAGVSQLYPEIPKKPKISFPPRKESLLGAVISFDSSGRIAVVCRLKPGTFESSVVKSPVREVSETLFVSPKSAVISDCLELDKEIQEIVRISISANQIESRSIDRKNKESLDKAIRDSLQSVKTLREGVKLYLVSAVSRGVVRVRLDFQDYYGGNAKTKLDGFTFKQVRPGMGAFLLESKDPIEFAYQADLLELSRGPATEPKRWIGAISAKVDEKPPANEWDKRIYMARKEKSHKVKVFYASDRHVRAKDEAASPLFWTYFAEFFLQKPFWLYFFLPISVLALIWILLVRFQLHKIWLTTRGWIIVSVLGIASVTFVFASIYARQETRKAVDSPMTADRGELAYGTCEVSIPKNHRIGKMERPFSVFLIDIEPEKASEHVMFLGQVAATEERFLAELKKYLNDSKNRECFVFVHGFNTDFEEAAMRTAQLWYDLQFPGAPIFYSWPSKGNILDYTYDSTEATWTEPHFESFLRTLAKKSSAQRIHIIAHSMGNRIAANVLAGIARSGDLNGRSCVFREIILAAPDIDADTFQNEIAPKFTKRAPHVTMYCSANDEALRASITVNGYRRAGYVKDGEITLVDGIDTIDASFLDTSFDTHSYFTAERSVVSDIQQTIVNELMPSKRSGLKEVKKGTDRYWTFQP